MERYVGYNTGESYRTIQEAVRASTSGDVIMIGPGRYEEKVFIETDGITLKGANQKDTIITYKDYARKEHADGREYGTFRTATLYVLADNVTVENLTIVNEAGDGRQVGQALALYADGDELSFIQCNFDAYQDTIFAGPLPAAPKTPGSFVGPRENAPYKTSHQWYHRCRMIGDVDFIFGSALALFTECEIISRNRQEDINGYVTAPSTWEHEPYGFIFLNSRFIAEDGDMEATVFIGRPWRAHGKVMLVGCYVDNHIRLEQADPWGNEANKQTARFMEFNCTYRADYDDVVQSEESPFVTIQSKQPSWDMLHPWHREVAMCIKGFSN